MKEGTYIFDDEFFRKYHQDNPDAILIGEDGIPRRPACWSPYFWIMVKTWKDAIKEHCSKPEVVLQANHINKNTLLWNRFFYKEQTPCSSLEDDENSLLDYINKNLEKLGQETFPTLSDLPKKISFSDTYWNNDIVCNFQQFIFPKNVYFENAEIDINANFSKSIFLDEANFIVTKFLKQANFHDSQFSKEVIFIGNQFFQEANFEGTEFEAEVDFSQAKFQGYTRFDNIRCAEDANFYKSEFGKKTSFSQAVFQGEADFRETKFKEEAYFGEATFQGEVNFSTPPINGMPSVERFYKDVCFKNANFHDNALFFNIIIGGKADFDSAYFDKCTNFKKVQFKNQAIFKNAQFREKSTARFDGMTCKGEFNFSNVTCHPRCFFTGADFKDAYLEFANTHFRSGIEIGQAIFPLSINSLNDQSKIGNALSTWRNIKNLAIQENNTQLQLNAQSMEFSVRQQDKSEEWIVRRMIAAYGWFSDYGRSVFKPISWILGIWLFFALVVHLLIFHGLYIIGHDPITWQAFKSAFGLSSYDTTGIFNLFSTDVKEYEKWFEQLYGIQDDWGYFIIMATRMIHKIVILLLFALLANSIRNHLRMR